MTAGPKSGAGKGRKAQAALSPPSPLPSPEATGPSLPDAQSVSPAARRLLTVAEDVARSGLPGDARAEGPSPLSEFIQIYREWISTNRGRLGTQQEQAEQWQLILYAMVAAATIEDAIHFLIRFGKVVWGDRGPVELRQEGDVAILLFSEPAHEGPEGLIAAIWPLALTLCELEFLANRELAGVSGRVPMARCLPDAVINLLFGRPIAFATNEVALVIPRHHLRRPVTARAADLPAFFRQLLPQTLGSGRDPANVQSLVVGLIRDDKRGPDFRESSLETVAMRLGMSASTFRRRLQKEGVNFRHVKEGVYNALAQDWLRQGEIPVEDIAMRLEFSNGFAFRRYFRRMNGLSPSAFRAQERE